MFKKIPKTIYTNYQSKNKIKPYYGLPKNIIFCSKCTYSNQKPDSEKEYTHTIKKNKESLTFDKNFVCSACRWNEKKKEIDWDSRKKELIKICNKYRKKNGEFDCLVPGSGGKDSFYAASKLKYEFGMNPITVTFKPHLYTDIGRKNFDAWIASGLNNYLFSPNIKVQRLLTRISLENLFHPFQPFIMGQMYFPPRMASFLNIPLIFYGENPSEYGNDINANKKPTKDPEYFSTKDQKNIFISGMSINKLEKIFKIRKADLSPYLPLNTKFFKKKKISVEYLGYYLKWHPQESYYYASEYGFEAAPQRSAGTYSKYSSLDDKIDDFHYYTTYIKFGLGRATYDSSQEIRNGEITREEGVNLVKRYDGEYPTRFENEIFEYLSINEIEYPELKSLFYQKIFNKDYFFQLANKFRSPHLWTFKNGKWKLKKTIF